MTRRAASKVRLALCGLLLSLACSHVTSAQDMQTVFNGVRDFVVSNALGDILIEGGPDGPMALYAAGTSEGGLMIILTASEKPELTREMFESEPEMMRRHGGFEVNVSDEKVTGLGDDNHFIEEQGSKGALLVFRKGVYHVRVFAASRAAAEGVAWNIVTLIPSE